MKNLHLKMVALLVAFLFWYTLKPGEAPEYREEILKVPVELVNIPPHLIVVNDIPLALQVRVRGEKKQLELYKKQGNVFMVDLSQAKPRAMTIPIFPQDLGIPDNLEVISIVPFQLEVVMESRLTKLIPVSPQIENSPPKGYTWDIKVTPDRVMVQGPESVIKEINTISTIPFSALEPFPFETTVLLNPPHALARIVRPREVTVSVHIEKKRRRRR